MTPAPGGEVVLVAMISADRVLGDGETQPWHFREDLRRFKALSTGHPLVMGRRTHEAIGRFLPGRDSVVVTRDPERRFPGGHAAHSVEEAIELARGLPGGDAVMVIGGGEIYRAALPHATRVELTEVDAPAPPIHRGARSVTFPELDPASWREAARDDRAAFAFVTYERVGAAASGPGSEGDAYGDCAGGRDGGATSV